MPTNDRTGMVPPGAAANLHAFIPPGRAADVREVGPGRPVVLSPIRDWPTGVPTYAEAVAAGMAFDDEDDDAARVGSAVSGVTHLRRSSSAGPRTCWVCERGYESKVVAFGPDGDHAHCAMTAASMESSFREQRQRVAHASPLTSAGAVDWMTAKW